jgi:predicted PurR-regulated permease PerM
MAKSIVQKENNSIRNTAETAIRLALLFLLLYWCYGVIKPFIDIIIWAVIFAAALFPFYNWLQLKIGGRKKLSLLIILLLTFTAIIIPGLLFANSLFEGITYLRTQYETSGRIVPVAPEAVSSWPLVGSFLYEKWNWVSQHLGEALKEYAPQIKQVMMGLISSAASAGLAFLKFIISILVSVLLLLNAQKAEELVKDVFEKIIGEKGREFALMTGMTIRTVMRGILGIAFIQSFLFGIGMVVAGVPAAGLWFIFSLIFGIIQVGIFPVSIPVIIYVFAAESAGTAIPFLIWTLFVSMVDNILRPVMLGRGSGLPFVVIFVGAIGGLLQSGISGLFTGTVVFAVGYKLFQFWIDERKNVIP